MAVIKYDKIDLKPVMMEGAESVKKSNVISSQEGWDTHTLRIFRIEPGGFTPHHQHDWEHVNFVIKGKGQLTIDNETHELSEKDFAFVPPNTMHQFRNPFDQDFEFVCIVPNKGAY